MTIPAINRKKPFHITRGYGWDIILTQQGVDSFTVQYGAQIEKGLSYAAAAQELGACIMHAMVCEGNIDSAE